MKKILSMLLLIIMSICLFGACTTNIDDSSSDGHYEGEIDFSAGYDYTDTIKVWITNADSEVRLLKSFISAFNQVYPNIKVEYQNLDSLTDQLI